MPGVRCVSSSTVANERRRCHVTAVVSYISRPAGAVRRADAESVRRAGRRAVAGYRLVSPFPPSVRRVAGYWVSAVIPAFPLVVLLPRVPI